jgi:hypothetical protein
VLAGRYLNPWFRVHREKKIKEEKRGGGGGQERIGKTKSKRQAAQGLGNSI